MPSDKFNPDELRDPFGKWTIGEKAKAAASGLDKLIKAKIDNARLGQCYKLSGNYIAEHPSESSKLVHGSIQNFGNPRIDHAWVKLKNGNVWEPASSETFTAGEFDQTFHPKIHAEYDVDQAFQKMLDNEHYGPWRTH